jgi:hypothetical protein
VRAGNLLDGREIDEEIERIRTRTAELGRTDGTRRSAHRSFEPTSVFAVTARAPLAVTSSLAFIRCCRTRPVGFLPPISTRRVGRPMRWPCWKRASPKECLPPLSVLDPEMAVMSGFSSQNQFRRAWLRSGDWDIGRLATRLNSPPLRRNQLDASESRNVPIIDSMDICHSALVQIWKSCQRLEKGMGCQINVSREIFVERNVLR